MGKIEKVQVTKVSKGGIRMNHKDYFNKVAEDYEWSIYNHFNKGFPNDGYFRMNDYLAEILVIQDTTKILDIGIGTGILAEKLAQKGAIIYGIDYAEKMLEETKKKIPQANLYCCDIFNGLPKEIASSKFDYIIASFVFHLFIYEDQFKLIRQLVKNLTPKGQFILAGPAFANAEEVVKYEIENKIIWGPDLHFIVFDLYEGTLNQMNLNSSFTVISPCCGFIIFPAKP